MLEKALHGGIDCKGVFSVCTDEAYPWKKYQNGKRKAEKTLKLVNR